MNTIKLKGIKEVQNDYKEMGLLLAFPTCSFKCENEGYCKVGTCQNSHLTKEETYEYKNNNIINFYKNNPLLKCLVMGGLEPMDSFEEVIQLISDFRKITDDTVVIYTGYTELELKDKIDILRQFKNIIIKVGRFVAGEKSHYDAIIGVELASNNQYAIQI